MSVRQVVRDASPFLRKFRAVLMGRDPVLNNRWTVDQAARDQPPANLPPGCSHKLSANYYHTRDGRRLVTPDQVVAINSATSPTKLLGTKEAETAAKGEGDAVAVIKKAPKTPGEVYDPPCPLNI